MKKNGLLSLTLPLSFLILSPAMGAGSEKPDRCPSASSIQAVGVTPDFIERRGGQRWVVRMYDHAYETSESWGFSIALVAPSRDEAYQRVVKALPTLFATSSGPQQDAFLGWFCMYQTSRGYPAMTYTNQSALKMRHE